MEKSKLKNEWNIIKQNPLLYLFMISFIYWRKAGLLRQILFRRLNPLRRKQYSDLAHAVTVAMNESLHACQSSPP